MARRPSIPAEIKRQVLAECGHRCSVDGEPCPLELAHIVPWTQSKNHNAANLICLCASCHERADKEKWGEKTLYEYKRLPWVRRKYTKSGDVSRKKVRLEIRIDMEVQDFDDTQNRFLQHALAGFLEIPASHVRLGPVADGSTRVTVELPKDEAEHLLKASESNDSGLAEHLAHLKIIDVRRHTRDGSKVTEPLGRNQASIDTPRSKPFAVLTQLVADAICSIRRLKPFTIPVVAGLAANAICYIIARFLGHLLLWELLVIAGLAGVIAAVIVTKTAKDFRRYRQLATVLGLAIAIVTYTVGIRSFTARTVKTWDFEDGTAQGWGVYDEEKGRVVETPDIINSQKFALGQWSLEVTNINIPTESDQGKPAVKKWPALYYKEGLPGARLTASVYVPSNADFRFADVKFFLHAGGSWEWHESGRGKHNEGVILQPGKWVELSWDLRPHKTRGWASPWPWRDAFGIQVYVEDGTFTGPIYIDNVTIYK